MKTFLELDEKQFTDALLIIDIDGTITYDRSTRLEDAVIKKLTAFDQVADVHLFSHGAKARTREFAELAQLDYIESTHRKPSRHVLEKIIRVDKRRIVIGDKFLIDGLFAANIGAEFIFVKRVRHKDESLSVRGIYILDDIAGAILKIIFPLLPYFILLRPIQWLKNLLIFTPIFFAGSFLDAQLFRSAFFAAILFSIVSSAMYVFNDLYDAVQDRLHPIKRLRPIASGAVNVRAGIGLFIGLLLISISGLFFLPAITPIICAYIFLNIAYSAKLKHVAYADLVCIVLAYLLRVVAGGASTDIYVSWWLIACVSFGSLFIIVGKRYAEYHRTVRRAVLEKYSYNSLNFLLKVSATAVIISYALYTVFEYQSVALMYSTLFVMFIIYRIFSFIHKNPNLAEAPEVILFKDPLIFSVLLGWIIYVSFIFY